MKIKQMTSLVLTGALIAAMPTAVFAEMTVQPQFVGDTVGVRVNGSIKGGVTNEAVVLYVKDSQGDLVHISQQLLAEGGAYEFVYTINPENNGGEYTYEAISPSGAESTKYRIFDYKIWRALFDAVNSCDEDKTAAEMERHKAEDFALICRVYDSLDKAELARYMCDYVTKNGSFADVQSLKESMEFATALTALNQGKSEMVNGGSLNYTDILGIDSQLLAESENLSADGKSKLALNMMKKSLADCDGVNALYEKLLCVNLITNYKADGTAHAEKYLTDNGAKIGIDVSKYSRLSTLGKDYVLRTLCSCGVGNAEEFAAAYDAAIEAAPSQSGAPGGGGGGGGSSWHGNSSAASIPVGQPEVKSGFDDIGDCEWAREAIDYLSNKGIVVGKSKGQFEPHSNVLREEFAAMIKRGMNIPDGDGMLLADMTDGAWYCEYVSAVAQSGIMNGFDNGSFGIGKTITREDAATVLYRIMANAGADVSANYTEPFADDMQISDYAREGVYTCRAAGIINGYGDGRFEPSAGITRAETAVMLYRVINRLGK